MTPDKTPTPDELEALARKHGATSYRNRADTQHPAYGFTEDGLRNLLADVLAKQGSPVVAVEPVAWRHRMGPTDCWVDCSKEFHDWVLREPEAWKGDEVQALCIATPQPTQAQAGAVPMPKLLALKFHARRDKKATVTLLFKDHETADAWVRGIKGGQHGTE